ncbi:mycothione reductase [Saccharopolyspora sp. HNM0986]|uniref:mycothione reductase n=1 Tax=Saccharopolyspora galaxeae TaxID=2781241 RepID=UPI00190AEBB4|nr:mycothione reductase [Saccharopolyspora sp. HNM0986]MBK0867443.1 mycothione reductase [Saccharopolyspora sp. HNM0986]
MPHFDLVIIGSGSGNSIADERFADWNVAFVEKGIGSASSYGGTCLNVGCIPTKMLVHTADVAAAPGAGSRLGVDLELRDVRWRDVRDRIFGRIDAISDGGRRYRAAGSDNVTLFEGEARFTGIKQLTVETADGPETLTADRFVVAAGGRPTTPDIPGIDDTGFHTSDSVMRLDALPPRMIILGTGFVGAEFAHVFSALGVEVTVIGRSGRLLRAEDVDVSERFTELAAERWDVRLNRKALAAERDGDVVRLHLEGPDGAETVEAEQLLVAVGREPNSDLIDAETGGLRLRADRKIEVDSRQRTSVDGVWALGDISSDHELKHVANHEMRVVQHNLLHPDEQIESDHAHVPHAVFSAPQIAAVGLTEQDAQAHGVEYVSKVQEYGAIAYGWAMEDTTGFAKLLADPASGRILGAHIIGPQAPTLLQPLVQAMEFGLDARRMARGQYWIHPAMPELLENALLGLPLAE